MLGAQKICHPYGIIDSKHRDVCEIYYRNGKKLVLKKVAYRLQVGILVMKWTFTLKLL